MRGRNQDWHYDPYTGILYIATIFLDVVPPILRRGYSARRQQGAFKNGIRVRYVHGHDTRLDPFAGMLQRTVVKQAALDVIVDQDFNNLVPNHLDRVPLTDKAQIWQTEVEEFKTRNAKLYMV